MQDCENDVEMREKDAATIVTNSKSSALNLLQCYQSDEASESDESELDPQQKPDPNKIIALSSDSDESDSHEEAQGCGSRRVYADDDSEIADSMDAALKQMGEVNLHDLPSVPSLDGISIAPEESQKMGIIDSFIGILVLVKSLPGVPPLDIDTLLFLEQGKMALGHIFEPIGPVCDPIYVVRFNCVEDVEQSTFKIGDYVYFAPQSDHTHYVCIEELKKNKGCDASWRNDIEVPEDHQDFSDDEEERNWLRERKRAGKERSKVIEKNMLNTPHNSLNDGFDYVLPPHACVDLTATNGMTIMASESPQTPQIQDDQLYRQ